MKFINNLLEWNVNCFILILIRKLYSVYDSILLLDALVLKKVFIKLP